MTELKRCPFCGGEKVSIQDVEFTDQVDCENCGYITSPSRWNTRPIEDELNARIKELEEHVRASGYDPERLWE
jgi:hypothetical protein